MNICQMWKDFDLKMSLLLKKARLLGELAGAETPDMNKNASLSAKLRSVSVC